MSKILVTLDFDGVVSPIDPQRNFASDLDFELVRLGGFLCAISKATLSFLQELKAIQEATNGKLTVVWASSWEDLTQDFTRASEGAIPEFDFLELPLSKADSILQAAITKEASLTIVVEDDRFVHEELKAQWSRASKQGAHRFISFNPSLRVGLQYSTIAAIRSLIVAELERKS